MTIAVIVIMMSIIMMMDIMVMCITTTTTTKTSWAAQPSREIFKPCCQVEAARSLASVARHQFMTANNP